MPVAGTCYIVQEFFRIPIFLLSDILLTMVVAIVQVELRLEGTESLKDKRAVLRSLIERIRHRFQVSISEVGGQDLWGNATLGVAAVSNDALHLESILAKVRDEVEGNPAVEVAGWWQEIERR